MIVTKFDGNPMKYVEEETNCQKEERRKKELDLETDLDTVASVTSNDPRLTFDPITYLEHLKLINMYESYGHAM